MSKFIRKGRTPNLPAAAFNPSASARPVAESGTLHTATSSGKSAAKSVTASAVDWKSEYGEVLSDLKRTGLIAGLLLLGMVGLAFVI